MELILTCSSWQDAQELSDELLHRQLVDRIETLEVKKSRHESNSHQVKGINLIVQTQPEQLSKIEALANKLQESNNRKILLTALN
jgi:uncharacterized protein involved in tolerance to divalent cations